MRTLVTLFGFLHYMTVKASRMKKELTALKKAGIEEDIEKFLLKQCKLWSGYLLNKTGTKLTIIGKENLPKETCLFVANHQSIFDIPIIMQCCDRVAGYIGKKELEKHGILKYWMLAIGSVLIDRENIRESVKSINEAIEKLKSGHSMVIFPEGTRSKGPKLGEFKKGSLKLAIKSGVPIVPIAIEGSYKIREGNKFGIIKSVEVKATIFKPIYMNEISKEEQNNLAETIRETINNELEHN